MAKASKAITAAHATIAARVEIAPPNGIEMPLLSPELADRSESPATPPSSITLFSPEGGEEMLDAGREVGIPKRAWSAPNSSFAVSRAIAGQT